MLRIRAKGRERGERKVTDTQTTPFKINTTGHSGKDTQHCIVSPLGRSDFLTVR